MNKTIILILFLGISFSSLAQKKVLDHADFDLWKRIQNSSISNDGKYIMYSLQRGEKDSHLEIKDGKANLVFAHERGERGQFTFDSKFALFSIKAWKDSVKEMKRRKVKKSEMPKDTLAIIALDSKELVKIANIHSYKLPEKWSSHLAYQLTDIKPAITESTKEGEEKKPKQKKGKKVGKENGYHLVIRNLENGVQDTVKYVTSYVFAEKGKRLAYVTTGMDSTIMAGVYVRNLETNQTTHVLAAEKGKYSRLAFSKSGKNFGFVADLDTTKALVRPNELYYYTDGSEAAVKLVDQESAPEGYRVSADGRISFSEDDSKMYFGLATPPVVQDTSLLKEEIVSVEVWTYDEPLLYTMQEERLGQEKRRSYLTAILLDKQNELVQIGNIDWPTANLADEGNAKFALTRTTSPYEITNLWDGVSLADYSLVDIETGKRKPLVSEHPGWLSFSPKGKYVYGYNPIDTTWITFNVQTGTLSELTKGKLFYDEINDRPNYAYQYGSPGWTENDGSIILYDRYDLWEFEPESSDGQRLTKGREEKMVYRYNRLDNEERFIDKKSKWLLSTFTETNKNSGFYEFNPKTNKGKQLIDQP